jgi:hypothetical protein
MVYPASHRIAVRGGNDTNDVIADALDFARNAQAISAGAD